MIYLEATANIGMEAVLKREAQALGMKNIRVQDGLVSMEGKTEDISRLNLHLRTAERVHWVLARFEARSFTELFDGVYDLPWPDIMPKTANFITEAKSRKSQLFSLSDIQRITEKAVVNKLQTRYKTEWFEKTGRATASACASLTTWPRSIWTRPATAFTIGVTESAR